MKRFVGDLVWSGRQRSVVRATVFTVLLAVVTFVPFGRFSAWPPPAATGHGELSLNLALSAHFCGTHSKVSSLYSVYLFINARPDQLTVPLRDVLAHQAGSLGAYCASVTQTALNNENSLMWLERLALASMSNPSLADLAQFLMNVRLMMLAVFAFALLRSGESLFVAGVALAVGAGILTAVDVRYDTYPFLLTTPLFLAALYALCRPHEHASLNSRSLLVAAGLLGAATAFGANVRTSQVPSYAAMAAIFLYDITRRSTRAAPRSRHLGAAAIWCAVFIAGYALFHVVFITSLRPSEQVPNYAYHAFAHSLVIGLGVPETPFSRSQGLRWEDGVAFAIAARAGVEPLGAEYEGVLLRYYGRLWRRHPGEMWRTYATKFRSACDEVFSSAGYLARRFGVTSSPFDWLNRHTNGYVLFGIVAIVTGLAAHAAGQGSGVGFLFLLVAATAFFTLLESALVYSTFVAIYFSYFLFFLFLSAAAAIQWLIDRAAPVTLVSEQAATRTA